MKFRRRRREELRARLRKVLGSGSDPLVPFSGSIDVSQVNAPRVRDGRRIGHKYRDFRRPLNLNRRCWSVPPD